ncbi:hypothetical protein DSO57_1022195 [Entomophthora muscae]|uniref:Uncharacterized protein n=1 Tax=Entomophthora muscae TaxID=34485 RepID=A0ACC2SGM0_9FUNG|nr:hypothetical protein DSO57_1022195 [Entomophthora muscae]
MTAEDCKVFMCMPRSSQVCFLNQLLPTNSHQLRAQGCNTTVVGSKCSTVTHVGGEESEDSIFVETEVPLVLLPCLGFEDLHNWANNIVLETTSSPFATPSALFCSCHNSKELPSAYPFIINWFRVGNPKETLYVYVQALFTEDNTVTPIQLRACYHGSYDVEQLIGEVDLCLQVMAKDASGFSSQHTITITQLNQYI